VISKNVKFLRYSIYYNKLLLLFYTFFIPFSKTFFKTKIKTR
jgi:hypothetical protein